MKTSFNRIILCSIELLSKQHLYNKIVNKFFLDTPVEVYVNSRVWDSVNDTPEWSNEWSNKKPPTSINAVSG